MLQAQVPCLIVICQKSMISWLHHPHACQTLHINVRERERKGAVWSAYLNETQQGSSDIKVVILERGKQERQMGSSFKSMNSYNHNHNQNQRGNKPYALMLLLAFGAAILGVMVLHKVREKRIFTVLVKEKDQQLLTLHLLFQVSSLAYSYHGKCSKLPYI